MLHISANDNISPATIVWLCQAIEAIYATNDGKLLRNRVLTLINPPTKKRKKIYNTLQNIFKKRHSFAHGGSIIPHPLSNEVLDEAVDDLSGADLDSKVLGSFVLIETLRQLVLRNWITLDFQELLQGT